MQTQYDVMVLGMAPRVGELIAMAKERRREHMLQFFRDLADAGEDTRFAAIHDLIAAQSALAPEEFRDITAARLYAWIHMTLPEAAVVAASWEAVMAKQKAQVAMREVGVLQSLLSEYTLAQQIRLRALIPESVLGAMTQSLSETISGESPPPSRLRRLISGVGKLAGEDRGDRAIPSGSRG